MSRSWFGKTAKVGLVGISTASLLALLPLASANADTVHKSGLGGRVDGVVSFAENAYWGNLTVAGTKRDSWCARAKVIIVIDWHTDKQISSRIVCGAGQKKSFSYDHWQQMAPKFYKWKGAKVLLCKVHSNGSSQHCETVKYVDNPYS